MGGSTHAEPGALLRCHSPSIDSRCPFSGIHASQSGGSCNALLSGSGGTGRTGRVRWGQLFRAAGTDVPGSIGYLCHQWCFRWAHPAAGQLCRDAYGRPGQPGKPRPDRQLQRYRDRRRRRVRPGGGAADQATATTAGVLSFADGDASTLWSFSGTLSGTSVSGRHTLTDGTDAFSGNWSAQRTGNWLPPGPCLLPHPTLAPLPRRLRQEASR